MEIRNISFRYWALIIVALAALLCGFSVIGSDDSDAADVTIAATGEGTVNGQSVRNYDDTNSLVFTDNGDGTYSVTMNRSAQNFTIGQWTFSNYNGELVEGSAGFIFTIGSVTDGVGMTTITYQGNVGETFDVEANGRNSTLGSNDSSGQFVIDVNTTDSANTERIYLKSGVLYQVHTYVFPIYATDSSGSYLDSFGGGYEQVGVDGQDIVLVNGTALLSEGMSCKVAGRIVNAIAGDGLEVTCTDEMDYVLSITYGYGNSFSIDGIAYSCETEEKYITILGYDDGRETLTIEDTGVEFTIGNNHYTTGQTMLSEVLVVNDAIALSAASEEITVLPGSYAYSLRVVNGAKTYMAVKNTSGSSKNLRLTWDNSRDTVDGEGLFVTDDDGNYENITYFYLSKSDTLSPSESLEIYTVGSTWAMTKVSTVSATVDYTAYVMNNRLSMKSNSATVSLLPGYGVGNVNAGVFITTNSTASVNASSTGYTLLSGSIVSEATFVCGNFTVESIGENVFSYSGTLLSASIVESGAFKVNSALEGFQPFFVGAMEGGATFEINESGSLTFTSGSMYIIKNSDGYDFVPVTVNGETYTMSGENSDRVVLYYTDDLVILGYNVYYNGTLTISEGMSIGLGSVLSHSVFQATSGSVSFTYTNGLYHIYLDSSETVAHKVTSDGETVSRAYTNPNDSGTTDLELNGAALYLADGVLELGASAPISLSNSKEITNLSQSGTVTLERTSTYVDIAFSVSIRIGDFDTYAPVDGGEAVVRLSFEDDTPLEMIYLTSGSVTVTVSQYTTVKMDVGGNRFRISSSTAVTVSNSNGDAILVDGTVYLALASSIQYGQFIISNISEADTTDQFDSNYLLTVRKNGNDMVEMKDGATLSIGIDEMNMHEYASKNGATGYSMIYFDTETGETWAYSGSFSVLTEGEFYQKSTVITAVTDTILTATSEMMRHTSGTVSVSGTMYVKVIDDNMYMETEGNYTLKPVDSAYEISMGENGEISVINDSSVNRYYNPSSGTLSVQITGYDPAVFVLTDGASIGVEGQLEVQSGAVSSTYKGDFALTVDSDRQRITVSPAKSFTKGSMVLSNPSERNTLVFSFSDSDVTLETGSASLQKNFTITYLDVEYTTSVVSQVTTMEGTLVLDSGRVGYGNSGAVKVGNVMVTNNGDGTVYAEKGSTLNSAEVYSSEVILDNGAEQKTFSLAEGSNQTYYFNDNMDNISVNGGDIDLAVGEEITYGGTTYTAVTAAKMNFDSGAKLLSGTVSFDGSVIVGDDSFEGKLEVAFGTPVRIVIQSGDLSINDVVCISEADQMTVDINADGDIELISGSAVLISGQPVIVGSISLDSDSAVSYEDGALEVTIFEGGYVDVTCGTVTSTYSSVEYTCTIQIDTDTGVASLLEGVIKIESATLWIHSQLDYTFDLKVEGSATINDDGSYISFGFVGADSVTLTINDDSVECSATDGYSSEIRFSKESLYTYLQSGSVDVASGELVFGDFTLSGTATVRKDDSESNVVYYVTFDGSDSATIAYNGASYAYSAKYGSTGVLRLVRTGELPALDSGTIGVGEGSSLVFDAYQITSLTGTSYVSSSSVEVPSGNKIEVVFDGASLDGDTSPYTFVYESGSSASTLSVEDLYVNLTSGSGKATVGSSISLVIDGKHYYPTNGTAVMSAFSGDDNYIQVNDGTVLVDGGIVKFGVSTFSGRFTTSTEASVAEGVTNYRVIVSGTDQLTVSKDGSSSVYTSENDFDFYADVGTDGELTFTQGRVTMTDGSVVVGTMHVDGSVTLNSDGRELTIIFLAGNQVVLTTGDDVSKYTAVGDDVEATYVLDTKALSFVGGTLKMESGNITVSGKTFAGTATLDAGESSVTVSLAAVDSISVTDGSTAVTLSNVDESSELVFSDSLVSTLTSGKVSLSVGSTVTVSDISITSKAGTITVSDELRVEYSADGKFSAVINRLGLVLTAGDEGNVTLTSGGASVGGTTAGIVADAGLVIKNYQYEHSIETDDTEISVTPEALTLVTGSITIPAEASVTLGDVKITSNVGTLTLDSDGNLTLPADGKVTALMDTHEATVLSPDEAMFCFHDTTVEHTEGYATVTLEQGLKLVVRDVEYIAYSSPTVFTIDENGVTMTQGSLRIGEGESTSYQGITVSCVTGYVLMDNDGKLVIPAESKVTCTYDNATFAFTAVTDSALMLSTTGFEYVSGDGSYQLSAGNVVIVGGKSFTAVGGNAVLSVEEDVVALVSGKVSVPADANIVLGTATYSVKNADSESTDTIAATISFDGIVAVPAGAKVTYTVGTSTQTYVATADSTIAFAGSSLTVSNGTGTASVPDAIEITYQGFTYTSVGETTLVLASTSVTVSEGAVSVPESASVVITGYVVEIISGTATVASDGTVKIPAGGKVTITKEDDSVIYAAETESELQFDGTAIKCISGSGTVDVTPNIDLIYNSCTFDVLAASRFSISSNKLSLVNGSVAMSEATLFVGNFEIFGTASITKDVDVVVTVSGTDSITVTAGEDSQSFGSVSGKSFEARLSDGAYELIEGTVVLNASAMTVWEMTISGKGTLTFESDELTVAVSGTNAITIELDGSEISYASIEGGSYSANITDEGDFELISGTVLIPEGYALPCGTVLVSNTEGEVYLKSNGEFILGAHSSAFIGASVTTFAFDSTTGYPIKNDSDTEQVLDVAETTQTLETFYSQVAALREEMTSNNTGADISQALQDLDNLVYDASLTTSQNETILGEVQDEYEESIYTEEITRFEAYKEKVLAELKALHEDGESAGAYSIIETARAAVSKIYYDKTYDYNTNRARLDPYLATVIADQIEDIDEDMFEAYKTQILNTISALHIGETCRGEKALIDDAYAAVSATAYSADLTLLDNQALLDDILAECNLGLEGYRSSNSAFDVYVEAKITYLDTQDTFGSDDAKALVSSYKNTLASMNYISSETLDSNLARIDATMVAFEQNLNAVAIREFTKFKESQQALLMDYLSKYYEPEVKNEITKAQSDLTNIYYVASAPYADSKARVDDVMSTLASRIDLIIKGNEDKFEVYCSKYLEQFDAAITKYSSPVDGITETERLNVLEAINTAKSAMKGLEYDHALNLLSNKAVADDIATALTSDIYKITSEDDLRNVADEYARALAYVSNKVLENSTDKIDDLVENTKARIVLVYDSTDMYDAESLSKLKPSIEAIIAEFDAQLNVLILTADYDRVVDAAVDYLEERYSGADDTTVARLNECISALRAREMDSEMSLQENQAAIEKLTNDYSVELFKLRLKSIEGEFESYRDYLVWTLSSKDSTNSTDAELKLVEDCRQKLKAVQFTEGSLLYNTQALDKIYNAYLEQSEALRQKEYAANFEIEKKKIIQDLSKVSVDPAVMALLNAATYDAAYDEITNRVNLMYLSEKAQGHTVVGYVSDYNTHLNNVLMKVRSENLYDQSDSTKAFISGYINTLTNMQFDDSVSYLDNFRAVDAIYSEFTEKLVDYRYLDNSAVIGNINADGTSMIGGAAEYPEGETQIWGIVAAEGGLGDNASATIERVEVPNGLYDAASYAAQGSTVSVLSNGKAIGAFEVTLMSNGSKVTQFNGTYRIMILLPEDMRGYENVQVAYADEFGNLQIYDAQVVDNYLVFYTTHFSTFYLVGLVEEYKEYDVYVYVVVVILVLVILAYLFRIVRFDANGGTGTMASLAYFGDGEGTLPECGFTREGYRFVGWSRTPDVSGELITDRAEFQTLGKIRFAKFYAVWENDNQEGKE